MSTKSELLAWVEARALDAGDANDASRLVAAYCAEIVRADRKDRDRAAQQVHDIMSSLNGLGVRSRASR